MILKFNSPKRIGTQTGAVIQVEATRTQTGNSETGAEVVLSLFSNTGKEYYTILSVNQTIELIKYLQILNSGIRRYNEDLRTREKENA